VVNAGSVSRAARSASHACMLWRVWPVSGTARLLRPFRAPDVGG
jgi:hypothetical protein